MPGFPSLYDLSYAEYTYFSMITMTLFRSLGQFEEVASFGALARSRMDGRLTFGPRYRSAGVFEPEGAVAGTSVLAGSCRLNSRWR